MANFSIKVVFQFLLIMTMVVQPVALTYAMAGVDHSKHHQSPVVAEHGHDDHHGMHHDLMSAHGHEYGDGSVMSDCCDTSACCPAVLIDTVAAEPLPILIYPIHLHTAWQAVILPSEMKPPRRFLG